MTTYLLIGLAIPALALSAALGYYYVQFSRQIEARLHGGRDRVLRAMWAHPLVGQVDKAEKLTDLLLAANAEHLPWARSEHLTWAR